MSNYQHTSETKKHMPVPVYRTFLKGEVKIKGRADELCTRCKAQVITNSKRKGFLKTGQVGFANVMPCRHISPPYQEKEEKGYVWPSGWKGTSKSSSFLDKFSGSRW
jgi:hypothetical protein